MSKEFRPSELKSLPHGLETAELLALNSRLRGLARKLVGSDAIADDLVQEAWVAALDAKEGSVRGVREWMARVVRNLARGHYTRNSRRLEIEELATDHREATDEVHKVEIKDSIEFLRNTTLSLDEPYRGVLFACYFEGKSHLEIAERFGRTQSTVRGQVSRGINLLRSKLDGQHSDRGLWAEQLMPLANSKREPAATVPVQATAAFGPGMLLTVALVVATLAVTLVFLKLTDEDPTNPQPLELASADPQIDRAELPTKVLKEAFSNRTAPAAQVVMSTPTSAASAPMVPVEPQPVLHLTVDVLDHLGMPETGISVTLFSGRDPGRVIQFSNSPIEVAVMESDVATFRGKRELLLSVRGQDSAESLLATMALDEATERRIELRSRGPACSLTVKVLGPAGEPIHGAKLRLGSAGRSGLTGNASGVLLSEGPITSMTDAQGSVTFSDCPRVARMLTVDADGYIHVDRSLALTEETEFVEIHLKQGGTLHGVVFRADGKPAAGATVRVVDPSRSGQGFALPTVETGPDGAYQLDGLLPRPEYIFATLEGEDASYFIHTVVNIAEVGSSSWNAHLEQHEGLRVRFVDPRESPLVGHRVIVSPETAPVGYAELTTTDEHGEVFFQFVPDFAVALIFERGVRDMIPVARNITPREHAGDVLEITVPDGRSASSSLRGEIQDPGGLLQPGTEVHGMSGQVFLRCPVDPLTGRFQVGSFVAGRYELQLVVPGLGAAYLGTRDVSSGTELDLGEIQLPAPVLVQLDWQANFPTERRPWALELIPRDEGYRESEPSGPENELHSAIPLQPFLAPVTEIRLFPNQYRIRCQQSPLEGALDLVGASGEVEFLVPSR